MVNENVMQGEYTHSKTGNIYDYLYEVHPVDKEPEAFTMLFKARCSENKELEVKVYKQEEEYFYVTKDNPQFFENTKVKVLYERAGVMWLRSEEDFHKMIVVNGVHVPRFKKSDADFQVIDQAGVTTLFTSKKELSVYLETGLTTILGEQITLDIKLNAGVFEIGLQNQTSTPKELVIKALSMVVTGEKNLTINTNTICKALNLQELRPV